MRTSFLGLVFCCLAVLSLAADCPPRTRFHAELRAIESELRAIETTAPPDSLTIARQQQQLRRWLERWQSCYTLADSSYVEAVNQLAYLHILQRDFTRAIRYAERAISLYKKPSLRLKISDLAKAHYRLGVCQRYVGKSEKSIASMLEAARIARRHPEAAPWAAASYPYILYHYFIKGDFEKALLYADQGEKLARLQNDEVSTSKLLQQKSQALAELGRLEEAKQSLESALLLIKKYPEHHQSHAAQARQLGSILKDLGHANEGLEYYRLAYKLARKNGHDNLSDFSTALGRHYYDEGNYPKALEYYREALRIDQSPYSKSVLLDNMALMQRQLKHHEKALEFHQLGLRELSIVLSGPGTGGLPLARTIQAVDQKGYLLRIIQDKADTWLDFARHTNNDPVKLRHALRTYMLADSMIDLMRREHAQEGSKLVWRRKARAMFEQAIQTCHLLNDPAAALHFFEKSRAVLLSDKLNELAAGQGLSEDDANQEQDLRQRISLLQTQLSSLSRADTAALRLSNTLLAAQQEQEKFIEKLAKTNPLYYRYRYDTHVPDLNSLRRNLLPAAPERGAFLSYFVGDSALYGICVDQDRITLLRLDRTRYLPCIKKFKTLIVSREAQNRNLGAYLQAAFGLYETLVKPFGLAEGTKLIISPDGDFIPFAALSLSPTRPGDYLVRHHAISYTYSAGVLERSPRVAGSRWSAFRTFLGMAPVHFGKGLQQASLTGSDEALSGLGAYFLFDRRLSGKSASRRAFLQRAPDFRIVQLFTHATADSSRVEPKLYFADSLLRLSELANSRMFRTQLLVLSACQTGIGSNQRGEGVFSLARGFAAVGIPSTLTTLWSVETQPMFGLTELFYQNLTDCLPLDRALQKAQIEWLRTAPRGDQLPYAWAGVVLVGQSAPLFVGKNYLGWGLAAALLLLAGSGAFFWRRKRADASRG